MRKSTRAHPVETIKVIRLEVGAFRANCYLLADPEGNLVIIDPGDDVEFIEEKIRELSLKPKIILATHGHSDHVSGVLPLCLAYKIPFAMNPKDRFLLSRVGELSPKIDRLLKEGDVLKIGKINLGVLEIPGHTPGSLAFKLGKMVFCGDLFFADGTVGRYDFYYAKKNSLEKSIQRLKMFSSRTVFYPGHGEEFGNL